MVEGDPAIVVVVVVKVYPLILKDEHYLSIIALQRACSQSLNKCQTEIIDPPNRHLTLYFESHNKASIFNGPLVTILPSICF